MKKGECDVCIKLEEIMGAPVEKLTLKNQSSHRKTTVKKNLSISRNGKEFIF